MKYIDSALAIMADGRLHPERLAVLLLADEPGALTQRPPEWQLSPREACAETRLLCTRRGLETAEVLGRRDALRYFSATLSELVCGLLKEHVSLDPRQQV